MSAEADWETERMQETASVLPMLVAMIKITGHQHLQFIDHQLSLLKEGVNFRAVLKALEDLGPDGATRANKDTKSAKLMSLIKSRASVLKGRDLVRWYIQTNQEKDDSQEPDGGDASSTVDVDLQEETLAKVFFSLKSDIFDQWIEAESLMDCISYKSSKTAEHLKNLENDLQINLTHMKWKEEIPQDASLGLVMEKGVVLKNVKGKSLRQDLERLHEDSKCNIAQ